VPPAPIAPGLIIDLIYSLEDEANQLILL
jgi:hypothetical protein